MKRTRLMAVALAATTALTLSSCSTDTADGQQGAGEDGALDISLLTTYNGLPFYTAMFCGAQDAATELGGNISVSTDGPSQGMNAADQVPVLESVVNRGPDGLIFVPADPQAMLAPVENAINTGVSVVTADGVLDEEVALAQFRGDNIAGGALAAEEMVRLTEGQSGKVLVLDNRPGLPLTNDRAAGFIAGLEGADGIEILETEYFEDDPNEAATIVQSALQANPDIVGLFATSEAGATGAVNGLQSLDAAGVNVIAYDAGPVLVRALEEGALQALIAQGSYQQGYDAMTRLVQSLRGEDVSDLPFDNIVDNVLVTPENMDEPEVSKFLYPESCS